MEKTYYLYRHVRLDKNEPFYVGIGTHYTRWKGHYTSYRRAYDRTDRSNLWKKVYKKILGEYEVQIIFETSDYNLLLNKEKEFISLYGRKDLGTGTLVNLTNGGEGVVNSGYVHTSKHNENKRLALIGHVVTNETKQRQSLAKKGKPLESEHKNKVVKTLKINDKKCQCNLTGKVFSSLKEACKNLGYKYDTQKQAIRRNNTTAKLKFI